MGKHEEDDSNPQNPNLYPQELQLKLYQAFIFSIPILFTIILCLLFYLFYLKRRANNTSSSPHHSTIQHSTPSHNQPSNIGIKGDLKDKLHVILVDEELKARDSICCVCLGEFEIKEELRQLPLCKHVFHEDCIRHWLQNNVTCPLCRCHVISPIKMGHHHLGLGLGLGPRIGQTRRENDNFALQLGQRNVHTSSSNLNISQILEEHVIIQFGT